MGETILVLGGSRSGKSRLAERLAGERPPVTYVATASVDPADAEMAARVARHRADRPADWTTREVPRDIEGVLTELVPGEGAVLVDCLTLWLSNLMLGIGERAGDGQLVPRDDPSILAELDRVTSVGSKGRARVVWVSNEVGSGVIPANPMARRFADLQGMANQRLAAASDVVHFCVAGLSLRLK